VSGEAARFPVRSRVVPTSPLEQRAALQLQRRIGLLAAELSERSGERRLREMDTRQPPEALRKLRERPRCGEIVLETEAPRVR
jgi:hypothetical protein